MGIEDDFEKYKKFILNKDDLTIYPSASEFIIYARMILDKIEMMQGDVNSLKIDLILLAAINARLKKIEQRLDGLTSARGE